MDFEKSKNKALSVIGSHDNNIKRRKTDGSSTTTPKEALLLERRLKNRQATTARLLSSKKSVEYSGTIHRTSDGYPTPTLSPAPTSVVQPESYSPLNALHRQKDVPYLFHFFEKGSTSGTAQESHTATLETTTPKGVIKKRKPASNINQLRSDYAELQKVPACKFCNAKRLEYEPPGFCCGKDGSKLEAPMMKHLRDLFEEQPDLLHKLVTTQFFTAGLTANNKLPYSE